MQWLDLPDDLGPNLGSNLHHLHLDLVFTYIYIFNTYLSLSNAMARPARRPWTQPGKLSTTSTSRSSIYIYIYISNTYLSLSNAMARPARRPWTQPGRQPISRSIFPFVSIYLPIFVYLYIYIYMYTYLLLICCSGSTCQTTLDPTWEDHYVITKYIYK